MVYTYLFTLMGLLGLGLASPIPLASQEPPAAAVVIDDFEAYRDGALPVRWNYINRRGDKIALQQIMDEREKFYVVQEHGNKFLRGFTVGEAQRISRVVGEDGFEWDLRTHPILQWDWRALQLPEGANERSKNDTGAALYVTFDTDWLGRPKSIKYTYSSTLPVGSVISFGRLKVIVASTARDGLGQWKPVKRNVVEDYRRVFGKEPPDEPLSITLWSDTDDTDGVAEVDFDDLVLLPE